MNQNRHSKHQKMTAVREAGFCMIDAGMYLDTHPCDGKAMDYFNRYQQMYKEAVCAKTEIEEYTKEEDIEETEKSKL